MSPKNVKRLWFVLAIAGLVGAGVAIAIRIASSTGVDPSDIARLANKADRIVVMSSSLSPVVLFESTDRRDRDALRTAFQVRKPPRSTYCCCGGSQQVLLYSHGQQIAHLSNQHATNIRCSLWKSDAPIADVEAFLRWFDDRGIPEARREYEADREQQKQANADYQRWQSAMPPSLRPYTSTLNTLDPDVAPLSAALARDIPQTRDQIMALFAWYGSGTGPWSGFPSYEGIAETMLLAYPSAELVLAAEDKRLSVAQTEGAARLFAGWTFSQCRPDDLRLLSPELKARLLAHSLQSENQDKRARAQHAFGPAGSATTSASPASH